MRLLITGMGGELGTRVAQLAEVDDAFSTVVGMDAYPPRGRLTRAEFHRVDPQDRRKVVEVVRATEPEVLVHLGVYEPNARFEPTRARLATMASAVSTLGAAAPLPSLRRIVVRSGAEVYGRRRGAPTRPDEDAPIDPTTAFGASLIRVEETARDAGLAADAPVAALRLATVIGPKFPSPLGRYLRLPAVPVNPLAELPFAVLHQEDAALAVLAAAKSDFHGALNVVGPGAVTASQAVLRGRRIPVPTVGPGWLVARAAARALGAPLPDHVIELLVRGRVIDGGRALDVLDLSPRSADAVITQLYEWSEVDTVRTLDRPAR